MNSFPILIAEDSGVSRKILEKVLTKEGYEVVSAVDGLEALKLFNTDFRKALRTNIISFPDDHKV